MQTKSTNQSTSKEASQKGNSLNRRILRVVTLAVFALLTYFLMMDYYTTIHHAESLTLVRLKGIVKDLAVQIDSDKHLELTEKYQEMEGINHSHQDKMYKSLHKLLARTYVTHNLSSPIYTFVKTGSSDRALHFIATSSEEPYYRHAYTSFPEAAYRQLDQGGTLNLYEDEFGSWLSAFAPIKDKRGKVVAYVQADEKFDRFINEVRAKTLWNAFYCLIGFGIMILLLLPYLRQILKEEERQKAILRNSLEQTRRLSKKLERSEKALKDNAEKLKQSNKDLTDFAHIASHDLKSPIRNIAGFAQLLQRRINVEKDQSTKEYLDFIISSADRAQKLITGLLSYSTADKNMGEQKVFYMCDAIDIARQNLVSIVEEKSVKLVYDRMVVIKANSTLVAQVLQNLINNGIKYNTSSQPVIEIGTGIHPLEGRYFFVRDNGIGIPEEYQKDIFKMFTRLHSIQQYEGSGIGLAFCNRVIKAYGGKMWLESQEDQGATFFFTLPNAVIESEELVAID